MSVQCPANVPGMPTNADKCPRLRTRTGGPLSPPPRAVARRGGDVRGDARRRKADKSPPGSVGMSTEAYTCRQKPTLWKTSAFVGFCRHLSASERARARQACGKV